MSKPHTARVVSMAEAEQADFVVCCRVGMFTPYTDNESGTCSGCGHAVFFRPHVPKAPPKLCIECAEDWAEATLHMTEATVQ